MEDERFNSLGSEMGLIELVLAVHTQGHPTVDALIPRGCPQPAVVMVLRLS
jgi:hypothetical protein